MSEETHRQEQGTTTEVVATVPVPIMRTAVAVCEALNTVPDGERDDPYVARVTLGWAGEETDFALHPDEFGGYELAVLRKDTTKKAQPDDPDWP